MNLNNLVPEFKLLTTTLYRQRKKKHRCGAHTKMSPVPIPKLIFKFFTTGSQLLSISHSLLSLCKSAHFKWFFSLLNTPWSSGNLKKKKKKPCPRKPRQTREEHREIICSLRLGLWLFFKLFSISFGEKIISESKILTVLSINSEERPGRWSGGETFPC